MKLMNEDYTYNYTKFYGKKEVVFTLVGTRMERKNSKIENMIDEFKSQNGDYIELKRMDILEQVKLEKMLPVLTSPSPLIPNIEHKKWEKLKGRNT